MDQHIDVSDSVELRLWACRLNVTSGKLIELVGLVGPAPDEIRARLKREEIRYTCGRTLNVQRERAAGGTSFDDGPERHLSLTPMASSSKGSTS